MRLFQAALDTPLDSPFSATLSVHGLHFTVCAPSTLYLPTSGTAPFSTSLQSSISLEKGKRTAVKPPAAMMLLLHTIVADTTIPSLSFRSLVFWISLVNSKQGIFLGYLGAFPAFPGFSGVRQGGKILGKFEVFLGKNRTIKERKDRD